MKIRRFGAELLHADGETDGGTDRHILLRRLKNREAHKAWEFIFSKIQHIRNHRILEMF